MTPAQARKVAHWLRQRREAVNAIADLVSFLERVRDEEPAEIEDLVGVDFAVQMRAV